MVCQKKKCSQKKMETHKIAHDKIIDANMFNTILQSGCWHLSDDWCGDVLMETPIISQKIIFTPHHFLHHQLKWRKTRYDEEVVENMDVWISWNWRNADPHLFELRFSKPSFQKLFFISKNIYLNEFASQLSATKLLLALEYYFCKKFLLYSHLL